jgi:PAS domain S-box-containing protein
VAAVLEAMRSGEIDSHAFEQRCVSKQGHEVWVEIVLSAQRDEGGDVSNLIAVIQDVTGRKRTQTELELAHRALACSVDGVVIASARRAEGEIVYVNPAFTRITGLPAQEAIGRSWLFLGELGGDQPALHELCARMRREESVSALLPNARAEGWSEIRISPVVDPRTGTVTHHVGILEDVSERLEAAAERERLLLEAVGARAEAERAARAKDEFFALVSHELRSPLSAITSWLAVLRRQGPGEVRARALEVLQRNAALLTRLIGDLLDVSRIVSGKLEIEREPFDLLAVVQGAVTALGPSARERGVALELHAAPEPAFVEGEPERMEQVLRNVIENALKFTPGGGRVDVELATHGSEIELLVRDTGRGIAPEDLPRVFDRFRQGEARPGSGDRGLGLGLSIVRHLVELHGGEVEASSEGLGCGATIRVVLPAVPLPQRLAARGAQAAPDSFEGLCVLLLDDDRTAAEALAIALEEADAEVAWVRSAAEALAQADVLRPQVLVAEVDALATEAADLLKALRDSVHANRLAAAVALSTASTLANRRQALQAGFDAYLVRPFEPARLIALIRTLIARPRRVLVVDDDPDSADSLALLLSRRGFEVERAYDAESALRAAADFAPSVIVTDLRLGTDSGVELARGWRAQGEGRPLLVAATGRAAEELGEDAALFDGFVRKPIELDALLALIGA